MTRHPGFRAVGRLRPDCRLVSQADRAHLDLTEDLTHVLLAVERGSDRVIDKRYVTAATAREWCQRHCLMLPVTRDPVTTATPRALPVATQTDSADDHITDPGTARLDIRARAAGDPTSE